ncbi:unnamed protein product [Spirodela intermedia]|uniref:Association with the SNF1 complex (ASC) domain-containing protein n=1 Tax=Spirodela intermedia TaxID=51605 RepID=A0A7I8K1J0_SPIIN|nr:unnamed protein product [Spirodela intermedia]
MGDDHHHYREDVNLVRFEGPWSPDSTYDNPLPGDEDEGRALPFVPPQLQRPLLGAAAARDAQGDLPLDRDSPRSVVALSITHRFHSKYVSVVLYKPARRRGGLRALNVLVDQRNIRQVSSFCP